MAIFRYILYSALIAYAGIVAFMYFNQQQFTYVPPQEKLSVIKPFEEITYETHDGLPLYAWYAKPKKDKATIVHFHGNSARLMDAAYSIMPLVQDGYGGLLVEYRGYSGNPGEPAEQDLYKDAMAAYDWLVATHQPEKIVFYGMSLGTGVATYLANNRDNDGLILEAGFTSLKDMASFHYWYLPIRYMTKESYQSVDILPALEKPVLIIHGTADEIVPLEQARRNYDSANEPKDLVIIEGGRHTDLPYNGANATILKWLEKHEL